MEQKHTKLLQIISIIIIGLTVSCSKPNFKNSGNIIINEDSIIINSGNFFEIINDSVFILQNNMTTVSKYNLKTGEYISSFTITDSLELKKRINQLLKYLPKKDYKIITNIDSAKKNYTSNIFEIPNVFYKNEKFYFFTTLLTPYIGSFQEYDSILRLKKSSALITTDINFNIINFQYYKSNFNNLIRPYMYLDLLIYNDTIMGHNTIQLDKLSNDKKLYAISKFSYNSKDEIVKVKSNFVKNIFYPPDAKVFNGRMYERGKFKVFNKTPYVSIKNIVYNLNNSEKILTVDNDFYISDYGILDDNETIIFSSLNYKTKQYFLNYENNNETIKKEISENGKKIKSNCVHNNKIYLLTKDQENYYVEEYIID